MSGIGTVAAIDCGTNSIRLLVARRDERTGALVDLERRMEIVRLGYGVDRTGRFDPAAVERTLDACRRYRELILAHGAQRLRFAATSATRDAENREEFISGVEEILGVRPEVITGAEEAALSFRGAVSALDPAVAGRRLVVDIGGGSTEFVLGQEAPEARISIDMGSVRLTERHLRSDPPTPQEIEAATTEVDRELDRAEETVPFSRADVLVGVAGTVTTVTAVLAGLEEYSPDITHGRVSEIAGMREACAQLLGESHEERARRRVIHPGRIDVIGAGALIWSRILLRVSQRAGLDAVVTSEHDILDGLAQSLLDAAGERA